MSKYRIFETDEFNRQLQKFPHQRIAFIRKKLKEYVYPQLKEEPYFGTNIKKLKGYVPETWRYQIGNTRIFYSCQEKEQIVYMLTIDLRKDVYRN
ncbi:MAG: type II toxin-antitoxin system RelE/ParE family toxin [Nitrospinae bacterium]|nr:type II toxin-antitoxin system RelE/ParE family toxin [Nitrospinota bacterium]